MVAENPYSQGERNGGQGNQGMPEKTINEFS
jgi:hypothetical protein